MASRVYWLLGLVLAVILLFLWQVQAVLTAFVTGMVLAYLLDPLVEAMGRRGISRTLASLVPVVAFYLLFIGILGMLVPLAVNEATALVGQNPDYGNLLSEALAPVEDLLGIGISVATLAAGLGQFSQQILEGLAGSVGKISAGAAAVGDVLSLLVITPLVAFYLLRGWPEVTSFIEHLLPLKIRAEVLEVWHRIDRKLAGFVRGQLMVCAVQGVVYGSGLWLVGVNMGFVLGMLTGLLSFIPVMGGLLGMGLTLLVALIQFQMTDWVPYVGILGVFALGNVLESFVLTPKLMGNSVGLHPLWIIFALLAGGQLAGILGMLLAVPVAAVVSELLKVALQAWKKSEVYKQKV